MLPREDEELLDLEPGEAAEELLARMLEARRYRRAAEHLAGGSPPSTAIASARRRRRRPCAASTSRTRRRSTSPTRLGKAIGGLLRTPPPLSLRHVTIPRVSVGERLAHLRALLRRGRGRSTRRSRGADRVTVAVTLFALLELYKQGEATLDAGRAVRAIAITRRWRTSRRRREAAAS